MNDYEMNHVLQAKRYKRLLNRIRTEIRHAQEGITEDEVLSRLKTLEGIVVLLGNDAATLVLDWESQQRHEEEQDEPATN